MTITPRGLAWSDKLDYQIGRLEELLEEHAHGNLAPSPIGIMKENDEWIVDVTVQLPSQPDYDITVSDRNLSVAIQNTNRILSNQTFLLRNAARSAETYRYQEGKSA